MIFGIFKDYKKIAAEGINNEFKAFEKLANHADTIGLYNFDSPEQSILIEELVKRIPKNWQNEKLNEKGYNVSAG